MIGGHGQHLTFQGIICGRQEECTAEIQVCLCLVRHLQGDGPPVGYGCHGIRKDGSHFWQATRHAASIPPLPTANNLLPPVGPQ
jgi:hypothetical protein